MARNAAITLLPEEGSFILAFEGSETRIMFIVREWEAITCGGPAFSCTAQLLWCWGAMVVPSGVNCKRHTALLHSSPFEGRLPG